MGVLKYKDSLGNIKRINYLKYNALNNIENKIFISVENGVLSSETDSSINNKNKAIVTTASPVNITTLTELEGTTIKPFNYIKNSYDEIISYDNSMPYITYKDEIFTPVYGDEQISNPQSTIYWCGRGYDVIENENKIKFYFGCRKIIGDNTSSAGILVSTKLQSDEDLIINGANVSRLDIVDSITQNQNFYMEYNFSTSASFFQNHKLGKFRFFIETTSGIETKIFYTKVLNIRG